MDQSFLINTATFCNKIIVGNKKIKDQFKLKLYIFHFLLSHQHSKSSEAFEESVDSMLFVWMTKEIIQWCSLFLLCFLSPLVLSSLAAAIQPSSSWLPATCLNGPSPPPSAAAGLSTTVRHHCSWNGCWHHARERLEHSWQYAVHSPNLARAP